MPNVVKKDKYGNRIYITLPDTPIKLGTDSAEVYDAKLQAYQTEISKQIKIEIAKSNAAHEAKLKQKELDNALTPIAVTRSPAKDMPSKVTPPDNKNGSINNPPAKVNEQTVSYTDRKLIDLRKPPYNNYFKFTSTPSAESGTTGYYLDEAFANNLINTAKVKNIEKYIVNTAYRADGALAYDGTSHLTGQAIDLDGVIYKGEKAANESDLDAHKRLTKGERFADKGEKTRRMVDFHQKIKDGSTGLVSGIEAFNDPNEPMHIHAVDNLALGKNSKTEIAKTETAARKLFKAQKEAKSKDVYGATITDNPDIIFAPSALPDGTGTVVRVGPDVGNQARGAGGGTLDSYYSDLTGGLSDNKTKSEWQSMLPSQISLNDLTGQTPPRSVSISPSQINNLSSVSDSEMRAGAYLENKILKNVYDKKHPYGLAEKQDGPPASIKLVLDKLFENTRSTAAKNAWTKLEQSSVTYIDCFFVERMTNVSEERYQIMQSISDEYKIYFSGKRPQVTSIQGRLLNTYNQQWLYDFEYFYDNYLRGSKAVENKTRAFLTIADKIYEVLILKFSIDGNSVFDNNAVFSVDFITLQYTYTGNYKNPLERSNKKISNTPASSSNTQTEYDEPTQKISDKFDESSTTQNQAYRGTSTNEGSIEPGSVQNMGDASLKEIQTNGSTKLPINKYPQTLDGPIPDTYNPDYVNNSGKKSSRDALKKSPYAEKTKQVLLDRNRINNIDESKLSKASQPKTGKRDFVSDLDSFNNKFQSDIDSFTSALNDNSGKYSATQAVTNLKDLKGINSYKAGEKIGGLINTATEAQAMAGNLVMMSDLQKTMTGKGVPGTELLRGISKTPIDKQKITKAANDAGRVVNQITSTVKKYDPVVKDLSKDIKNIFDNK